MWFSCWCYALVLLLLYIASGPLCEASNDGGNHQRRRVSKLIFRTSDILYKNMNEKFIELFEDAVNATKNPGWTQIFFDGKDREHFIHTYYPTYLPYYHAIIPGSYKSDVFRFLVTYRYGGMYSDSGVRYLKPISEFIAEDDEFVGCADSYDTDFWTGWFATYARHPLIKLVINMMMNNLEFERYQCNHLDITGPRNYGRAFRMFQGDYGEETAIKPGKYLTAQGHKGYKMRISKFDGTFVEENGQQFLRNKFDGYQKLVYSKGPVYGNIYFSHKAYKNNLLEPPVFIAEGNLVKEGSAFYYVYKGKKRPFPNYYAFKDMQLRDCMTDFKGSQYIDSSKLPVGAMLSENATKAMQQINLWNINTPNIMNEVPWNSLLLDRISALYEAKLNLEGRPVLSYPQFTDFVEKTPFILHVNDFATDNSGAAENVRYLITLDSMTMRLIPDAATAKLLSLSVVATDRLPVASSEDSDPLSIGLPLEALKIDMDDYELSRTLALYKRAEILSPTDKIVLIIAKSTEGLIKRHITIPFLSHKSTGSSSRHSMVIWPQSGGFKAGILKPSLNLKTLEVGIYLGEFAFSGIVTAEHHAGGKRRLDSDTDTSTDTLSAIQVNNRTFIITHFTKSAMTTQPPRCRYAIVDFDNNNQNSSIAPVLTIMTSSERDVPLHETAAGMSGISGCVAFAHRGHVFFITSVFPFTIGYSYTATHEGSSGAELALDQRDDGAAAWLPWEVKLYGGNLTPAVSPILIGSKYLGLFYSSIRVGMRRAYYWGAYSMCNSHPFKLHSMSKFPIAREKGGDDTKSFPTGLWFDTAAAAAAGIDYNNNNNNSGSSSSSSSSRSSNSSFAGGGNEYNVWVSFSMPDDAKEDEGTLMMKLEVRELMRSMTLLEMC